MRRVTFVVPGDIETRTGGSLYDRKIVDGLRAIGWTADVRGPNLDAIAETEVVVVDGLALPLLDQQIDRNARRLRIVPLIHLPLALEVGLPADEAARRHAIERRALDVSSMIVVTGRMTKELLERDGVDPDRVVLVEPGTDPAPLAHGSDGLDVALLCVAALTPGKGHELLIRSLASIPARNWTLRCAGSLDRDPGTVERVRGAIAGLRLDGRVVLLGELDEENLQTEYERADAFVLATIRETYGMAVAEAIAHGLPVIGTTVGAIPDVVGGGGVLVAPGDESAFAGALSRLVADPLFRYELTERARQARDRLNGWPHAAQAMAAALERVITDERAR